MTTSDAFDKSFTLATPVVQLAFACENVSTDFAGRVSFQNLIDALNSATFPTTTPMMFVIFGFMAQLAGFLTKPYILIEDENQVKIFETNLRDMSFTADAPIARAIVGVQGVQWPHAGRYTVKFLANGGKLLGSFPISLIEVKPASFGGTNT